MSKPAVYVQFLATLETEIQKHRIVRHEKKHWVVLEGPNGHRVAIKRSPRKLPRIETTLDLPVELPEVVEKIELNGRMKTALVPRPDVVRTALEMLADPKCPIPAPRRGGGANAEVPDLADLLAADAASEQEAADELEAE